MKASIVIPAFNSCERLKYNLLALDNQSCSIDDFEVIVIDNGSKDNTWEMLINFKSRYKLSIIKLEENKTPTCARNLGILNSNGEIIIFHDSDMLAPRDFIRNHLTEHESNDRVICGACWKGIFTYYYTNFRPYQIKLLNRIKHRYPTFNKTQLIKNKQPLLDIEKIIDGSFINYGFNSVNDNFNPFKKIVNEYGHDLRGYNFPWDFFVTNNCSLRKEYLVNVGLFDENFEGYGGEDLELGYRLFKGGYKFKSCENIVSYHQEHPSNFKDNGGKSCLYFCNKHNNIDVLLLYFGVKTSIDDQSINNIINELKVIDEISKYRYLIAVFKDLLNIVKERLKPILLESTSPCLTINADESLPKIDFLKIKRLGDEICNTLHIYHFVKSLYLLIIDVYGIDIVKYVNEVNN